MMHDVASASTAPPRLPRTPRRFAASRARATSSRPAVTRTCRTSGPELHRNGTTFIGSTRIRRLSRRSRGALSINLLASGGGTADRCIKFWNTNTGALLNSIDTHSQVCSLQWNKHERELLSSHGYLKTSCACGSTHHDQDGGAYRSQREGAAHGGPDGTRWCRRRRMRRSGSGSASRMQTRARQSLGGWRLRQQRAQALQPPLSAKRGRAVTAAVGARRRFIILFSVY